MLSDTRQISSSTTFSGRRLWALVVLLVGAAVGTAALVTVAVMGTTTLAGMRLPWLVAFLIVLAGAFVWWALYLWLLDRLGGLEPWVGLNRSTALVAILSLSLLPDLAVFLSGKLPYALPFDADTQSLYQWMAGLLLFLVFIGQELVLAGAVQGYGLRGLLVDGLRRLSAFPGGVARLPGATVWQVRRHPLLVVILAVGIVQRVVVINEFHSGDMNDTLNVARSTLTWTPWGYFHYYRPQPSVYAHLPLFPMLIAPFSWFFETVTTWPTPWAAKLISTLADVATAALIYHQAKNRWKGNWGLILAAAWFLSPVVVSSDDHAVGLATAFTIVAFATLERGWLCGLMIGLGAATRNEVVFLALPLIVHFVSRRDLREKVAFLGAFLTVIAVVGLPFVLTDPEAIDYAMRRQSLRQAAVELSTLLRYLQPHLSAGITLAIQQNPTLLTAAVTFPASLLAVRDSRVTRVVLVVALAYLLALPVLHPRYTVFAYAVGLFYAARYGSPLVAVAIVAATWPAIVWGAAVQLATAGVMAVLGLLRLDWPGRADVRKPSGLTK